MGVPTHPGGVAVMVQKLELSSRAHELVGSKGLNIYYNCTTFDKLGTLSGTDVAEWLVHETSPRSSNSASFFGLLPSWASP